MITTSNIKSLFSFPEKVLGLVPIIPADQKQELAQTVRSACDWVNADSPLAGMKPVEILCVTLLGILLTNYLLRFVRYLASFGSVQ